MGMGCQIEYLDGIGHLISGLILNFSGDIEGILRPQDLWGRRGWVIFSQVNFMNISKRSLCLMEVNL